MDPRALAKTAVTTGPCLRPEAVCPASLVGGARLPHSRRCEVNAVSFCILSFQRVDAKLRSIRS
eukprot:7316733-Prymnesium_polylepis.1